MLQLSTARIRDQIAALSRTTPYFRGKRRLGVAIGKLLTNLDGNASCIATVKMKNGSEMQVDVRSRTEQWPYWTGDYDNGIISKFLKCFEKKFVVLDVGANVGFYTIPFAEELKRLDGYLYAFEPVKSNFARLNANVSLNGLEDLVSTYDVALGNYEGTVEMTMESTNNSETGNAAVVSGELHNCHFNRISSVQLTQLDTFAPKNSISNCDFIKVDIEGAEVMFLEGSREFIEKNRPIIYGEFNSFFLEKYNSSVLDAISIISPLNYRIFKPSNQDLTEVETPTTGLENILLVPSEKINRILSTWK